jgi:hypothetical protein
MHNKVLCSKLEVKFKNKNKIEGISSESGNK